MARHATRILTSLALVLAIVLTAGCTVGFYTDPFDPAPAPPIQVYVQDTWDTSDGWQTEMADGTLADSGGERGRILRCIDEWNFRFREETGSDRPIIVFVGLYHDPDGFQVDDLNDGRIVVYKTDDSRENPDVVEMFSASGYVETYADSVRADTLPPDPANPGFESTGEVLIFADRIEDAKQLHGLYLDQVWYRTCHEFGHVLGLFHEELGAAVMHQFEDKPLKAEMTSDELALMASMRDELSSPYRPGQTVVYPLDADDLVVRGVNPD